MAWTEWRGMKVELVDTAGWLKKAALPAHDDVGGYLAAMTLWQGKRAMHAVHVVVLMLDAVKLHDLKQVRTQGIACVCGVMSCAAYRLGSYSSMIVALVLRLGWVHNDKTSCM